LGLSGKRKYPPAGGKRVPECTATRDSQEYWKKTSHRQKEGREEESSNTEEGIQETKVGTDKKRTPIKEKRKTGGNLQKKWGNLKASPTRREIKKAFKSPVCLKKSSNARERGGQKFPFNGGGKSSREKREKRCVSRTFQGKRGDGGVQTQGV